MDSSLPSPAIDRGSAIGSGHGSHPPGRVTAGGLGRRMKGAVAALLVVLVAGCLDESPMDPTSGLGAFTLLGGLDVGESLALEGEEAGRLFLPGTGAGSEFVVVPFFGTDEDVGAVTVRINGGELLDVVGPPRRAREDGDGRAAGLGASAPRFPGTGAFHRRLRRAEIRELEPRLRTAGPGAPSTVSRSAPPAAAPLPEPGDTLSLLTLNPAETDFCANPLQRGGRVVAVTPDVIMVSDTASPAELTDPELASIADEFGSLVQPVAVDNFGAPTDIDQNDRVMIFFTPVVNELEAGGFTFTGDLFSTAECAASNEGEIFYILSPDPSGETPVQADGELVADLATGIIAHEFQHLINGGRRIYVNGATQLESVWMNEGLSHISEELVFYAATRFGPRQNLSLDSLITSAEIAEAADRFVVSDLFFYASYAADPTAATFIASDDLETRGMGWSFLRYAADQEDSPDAETFFDLVNSTTSGIDNLNRVLDSGDAVDLLQAWSASVFADDAVDDLPPFLTQPSWHHRSILPLFTDTGDFPLSIETIEGGGPVEVSLQGGGSAFFRIRVPAGQRAELSVDVTGSSSDALRVSVVRAE